MHVKACSNVVSRHSFQSDLVWLFAALFFQLTGRLQVVHAETYYKQYRVRSSNLTIGATKDTCINSCLTSLTCSAVSYCNSPTPLCFMQYCANIQLVSAAACTTIVLADIQLVEGVNIPSPIHEWMLTDSCGLTFINTAAVYAPAMTVSPGMTKSYTPVNNRFFGNSLTSSSFKVQASQVQIDFARPFSLFFWFKSFVNVAALTIASITYTLTQSGTSHTFSVNYEVNNVKIATTIQPFSCIGQNFSISVGQWHYFAFVYAANGSMQVFFDGENVLSANTGSALSSLSTPVATIESGSQSNFPSGFSYSIYCYKIFNLALSVKDIQNIANTCLKGKITTASIGCAPSNFVYNGKYYYFNLQTPNITGAFSVCESQGQQLMKMDNLTELTYLSYKLPSTPSNFWWTSLYGTNDVFTWLSDGSTLLRSSLPNSAWWIDSCCDNPVWCFVLKRTGEILADYGCNSPGFGGLVCTCQLS